MENRKTIEELQSMNVQQVRTYIRQLTKEANKVLYETSNESYMQGLADEIRARNDMSSKTGAFVGRLNYKRKDALISQAEDLQMFIEADLLSETAKQQREETIRKRYESFKENSKMDDLTYEEYKTLAHDYSAVEDLIGDWGSDVFAEIYTKLEHMEVPVSNAETTTLSHEQIINVMREVHRETKGQGYDPLDIEKLVYSKLGLK